MTDAKWKSRLLSSSVPLEFEVARTLTSMGFGVRSDYLYSRDDAGIAKDFSVDLHAIAYPPFRNDRSNAALELLVECKFRHSNTKWLFFPDPNPGDLSPFTLGTSLRAVDNFSRWFFPPNATIDFDESANFCFKGIEIDLADGKAYDAEIRHGIAQLQYALPRLLADNIRFHLYGHKLDNLPFFFCPILVTTAKILLAKDDTSLISVQNAESIDDLAVEVPYVILATDPGPDFEKHRLRECLPLEDLAKRPEVVEISKLKESRGEYEFELPDRVCRALAKSGQPFHEYFGQVVVCSLPHFEQLVSSIKTVAAAATKRRSRKGSRNVA
jgi:hypothetical protein